MERRVRFWVEGKNAGERLDYFLSARLVWLSRLHIARRIAEGACTVNQIKRHAGYRLRAGDAVEIDVVETELNSMKPEPLPIDIVYEDEHLLVVDKPAGMLVHPTLGVKTGTLLNALAYHLNGPSHPEREISTGARLGEEHAPELRRVIRPGLVHRLDRATSGLMVIAKTQRALSQLSRHFHQRKVEKRYLALLDGSVAQDEVSIDWPIGRAYEDQPQWRVTPHGKNAETRLRVLHRAAPSTLVELEPITGRTNQLRIHCAHLGHPIVGDKLYGRGAASRLCLHAAQLAFHHPARTQWMQFSSPLPAEVSRIMNDFGG